MLRYFCNKLGSLELLSSRTFSSFKRFDSGNRHRKNPEERVRRQEKSEEENSYSHKPTDAVYYETRADRALTNAPPDAMSQMTARRQMVLSGIAERMKKDLDSFKKYKRGRYTSFELTQRERSKNTVIAQFKYVDNQPDSYPSYFKEHPAERKVVMTVSLSSFPSSLKQNVIAIAQHRYSPEDDTVVMAADRHLTRQANKDFLIQCWKRLLSEAKDPANKELLESVEIDLEALRSKGARKRHVKKQYVYPSQWLQTTSPSAVSTE